MIFSKEIWRPYSNYIKLAFFFFFFLFCFCCFFSPSHLPETCPDLNSFPIKLLKVWDWKVLTKQDVLLQIRWHNSLRKFPFHCVKSFRIWSFSSPYFPVFGLNMKYLSVFSPNTGKYGPEKFRIPKLFTQCWLLLSTTVIHLSGTTNSPLRLLIFKTKQRSLVLLTPSQLNLVL